MKKNANPPIPACLETSSCPFFFKRDSGIKYARKTENKPNEKVFITVRSGNAF